MLQTSIIVELLRSQPRMTFWSATLAQAALWWVFPSLFYSAPPGDLPTVLAVGHEFQLGSYLGPPLAFWLAELAYVLAGSSGVYLLAQACIVLTYYAVFMLGRAIVGIHHAAFAVLLMTGIFAFTAPSPNFGPTILAMPLTAFALLSLWRAVGERRRTAWFALASALGLLLLTTYAALVLAALVIVFLAATRRGRRALRSAEPWLASVVIVVIVFPHLIWLDSSRSTLLFEFRPLARSDPPLAYLTDWIGLVEKVFLAHAGLVVLVALGSKWHLRTHDKVPVFVRSFTDPFARRFVFFFALAMPFAATVVAVLLGEHQPVGGVAPHLVLSGLAIIVLAGNSIPWHRPRLVGMAWLLLLLAPPLSAAAAIVVLPWFGVASVDVGRPASAVGHFFADSFERRTNMRLAVVTGDSRLAALVALGAPTRPSLYFSTAPERSPWVTLDDIHRKGAVVVWPSVDTKPGVPAAIASRFPDLVAEVPRVFERFVQGRLPLWRLGWGVVRPQSSASGREGVP